MSDASVKALFPPVIRDDMPWIARQVESSIQRLSGTSLLITGANGFLPAYLADSVAFLNLSGLLAEPCRLILQARDPDRLKRRLGHLLGFEWVCTVVTPIDNPEEWVPRVAECESIEFWVHAASPASPAAFHVDPLATVRINTTTLDRLLDLSRSRDARSFLYFSSSEIYGSARTIPTPESYVGQVDPMDARAVYAESKRAGETLCSAHHRQHRLPIKVVRPFHIHGPGLRLDDGRIISTLMRMGLRGEPFRLLSDGSAIRTYAYVAQSTAQVLRVLVSQYEGHVFNIGADAPQTTIIELAKLIAQLFGVTAPVQISSDTLPTTLQGAPVRACPDLSKLHGLVGRVPIVEPMDALSRTLAWYRQDTA